MAWNGRQLINHPAELDIAHVRADAMNAPACTSRPFHSWTCAPTRARAQFCRSSSPLFLASCSRILDLSLDVRPLVPVSSLSSSIESVRLCLPDTLDPRPLDLPIGTVAATLLLPPPRSTLECTLHPRLIVSRRHAIRARFRRLFR